MGNQDNRWKQRFMNFIRAFNLLDEAAKQDVLNDLEEQELIQRFEFTHELAWNVLKDYFEYQGNTSITGSRDATREAFNKGLVDDGDGWMQMLKSRNQTSHTYNDEVADQIVQYIVEVYHPLFTKFKTKMNSFIQ